MKTFFKCENCGKETIVSGEGLRHLGCQSCGCGDIKFDSDVVLTPVSNKNPGDKFDPIIVKKGESFLASHSNGNFWLLFFPVPEKLGSAEPLRLRKINPKKIGSDEGFYNKILK